MSSAEIRRKYWRRVIIVSLLLSILMPFFNPFKKTIYIKAPSNMKWAFQDAMYASDLYKDYKFVFTDSEDSASVVVIEGGNNAEGNKKFAFSPFICATAQSVSQDDMEDENVLVKNRYDEDILDIDVKKIITGVLEEGYWKDSKLEDYDNLTVYYPDKSTPYWYDFYNFMLITVNEGKYPKTANQLVNAEKTINKFMASEKTEAVIDFDEKMSRNGGYSKNTMYLIPEVLAMNLSRDHDEKVQLFYPIYTVNYNLFIKCNDELGERMVDNFDEFVLFLGDFYKTLENRAYRSEEVQKLNFYIRYDKVSGLRNTYEVINDLSFVDDSKTLEDN